MHVDNVIDNVCRKDGFYRRGVLHGIKSIDIISEKATITTHCNKMFLIVNSRNSRAARWLRNKWFTGTCGVCRIPEWKLEKYSSTRFERHYGSALNKGSEVQGYNKKENNE